MIDRKQKSLCRLHTLRAVYIGSCITCTSSSPICETKGCIKHHLESQKMHTTYTVRDIEKIANEYQTNNDIKRGILKKLVTQYFQLLKSEIESLYHQVVHTAENMRFQNFLMDETERKLTDMLLNKRYSELTCSDIARIVPKILKCNSFEEKQFNHLKDFIQSQMEQIPKAMNSIILNLPYFRQDQTVVTIEKFTQISDELLSNVNIKLQKLAFRPKKIRIRYIDDDVLKKQCRVNKMRVNGSQNRSKQQLMQQKFIKLLENLQTLKDVEIMEFYCTWNINEEDFQIEFFDAVLSFPFLSALTIFTGYRVTAISFIEQMVESKNIELKIYKKEWHF